MELYWYIVVIIFIIIKIFFYVCWYRSRQRQLAAYLSNPRNAQIVIVGGRAYLHQVCERPSQTSIWPSWYGVQDEVSMEEASAAQPPAPAFSQLDMPPPYEAVSGEDDLKPPSYSECARGDGGPPPSFRPLADGVDAVSINEAPPPYTPSAGAAAAASSSSAATPANRQEAPARQGQ